MLALYTRINMDPLSLIFASYLDMVSNTVHSHVTDVMGTEISVLAVDHGGITVPYSYQLWQIRAKTVCSTYSENVLKYSRCTIAARSLFSDICQHLQENPSSRWKQKKLKNMYCNAAMTYQPTVATVQWSGDVSVLEVARAECNTAIAGLMGSSDLVLRKKKEKACGEYRKLQQQANK